jgi:hypothetical protein
MLWRPRPLETMGQAMSEYLHLEKPFLDQLKALGWTFMDPGQDFLEIP